MIKVAEQPLSMKTKAAAMVEAILFKVLLLPQLWPSLQRYAALVAPAKPFHRQPSERGSS